MKTKNTIAVFMAASMFLFACGSCVTGGAKVGLPAPALSLPRLGGGQIDIASLKGKVVMINFWATWCEPCKEEMPDIEKLYRTMEGKPFEILAVSVDTDDGKVGKLAGELNLSFPILRDPNGNIAKTWGTIMYPETYIVGPDGIVKKKIIGATEWTSAEMIKEFNDLMPK